MDSDGLQVRLDKDKISKYYAESLLRHVNQVSLRVYISCHSISWRIKYDYPVLLISDELEGI